MSITLNAHLKWVIWCISKRNPEATKKCRIGCMDFDKIPALKSIFIKDGFYDLLFEVEDVALINQDETMDEAHGNGDNTDNGNGNSGGLKVKQ
jgi:hypothetical protein